jgi:hypothetical protein
MGEQARARVLQGYSVTRAAQATLDAAGHALRAA